MDMDTTTKVIDEDFTDNSNGWITSDDTNMSVDTTTNFRIDYDLKQDGTNDTAYVDVGILPDNWILDFDINPTTYTQGNATDLWGVIVGISSVTGGTTTSQDALYTYSRTDTTLDDIYLQDTDGTTIQSQLGGGQIFTTAQSTGVKYYRLTRVDSTNAKLEIFSNADRLPANLTESQTLVTGALANLRYIKVQNHIISNSPTSVNSGIVDNIRLTTSFDREQSVYDANYKAVYHLQGNSLDSTVYGNDGTNTAVDWEQQNNSVGLVANGTTTKIDVSADTSINNVWVSGGEVEWTTNLKSDGEASGGRFFDKRGLGFGWTFIGEDEASGLIRIRLLIDFTTTNGQWETTNTVIPINEVVKLTVKYNGDSIENDPILIINGVKYTVGNGLTEVVKPAGSIRSDSSQAFTIANVTVQTTTIDGFMDNVKLSDKIRPSSQAIATYNAEKADSDILTVGSESTPLFSNVETNSVFIKTDTNKRFWYNGTTWVEQA